ncbi:MAG: 50S ribosomal protein L6 [Terrimicrobiaceae bacterium]
MSRIGKKPITIPAKVKVAVNANNSVLVEGPKGKLEWKLPASISAQVDGEKLAVNRTGDDREHKALHGLSRALLSNMIVGVTNGFKRDMEIHGVGFKAAVQGKVLNLSLGKSHPILFTIPEGVKITVTENTKISIEGIDNQLVGQCAANIRAYYPPEPYKGKGVRFAGEHLRRKEGKTVQ